MGDICWLGVVWWPLWSLLELDRLPRLLDRTILIPRQHWDWHQQHLLDIDVTDLRPHHYKYKQQTTLLSAQPHLSIPWLFCDGFTWLGWGICAAAVILGKVDLRKSSSISRTLESKDLEEVSLMSSSFIFLAIMMVFLVIFSPGRPILRSQGSHWRKTTLTCSRTVRTEGWLSSSWRSLFVDKINDQREREREGDTHPVWHVVGVRHPVMIVEDHYRRPEHQQQYWGEEKHKTGQWTLN